MRKIVHVEGRQVESLHNKAYLPLPSTDEGALDPNSSYARLLRLIDGPVRVVDFGCGPGNLARFLSQRGCTTVGVDANPDSASLAREYCEEVLVADLDSASLVKLFPSDRFDIAIFADILEHLQSPARLLRETHQILRAGGCVLASIPNVSHGAVRLSLLQGDFNYEPLGVLDDTHLRFFTRKSMQELFQRCDFAITELDRTTCPVFGTSALVPSLDRANFSEDLIAQVEREYDSATLQFIVKAVPVQSLQHRRTFASAQTNGERHIQSTVEHSSIAAPRAIDPAPSENLLVQKDAELQAKQAEIDKAATHIADLTERFHALSDIAQRNAAEIERLRADREADLSRQAALEVSLQAYESKTAVIRSTAEQSTRRARREMALWRAEVAQRQSDYAAMEAAAADLSHQLAEEQARRTATQHLYERAHRRNNQLRQQLKRLADDVRTARQQVTSADPSAVDVENRACGLERQIEDLATQNAEVAAQLRAVNSERDAANEQCIAQRLEIEKAAAHIAELTERYHALRALADERSEELEILRSARQNDAARHAELEASLQSHKEEIDRIRCATAQAKARAGEELNLWRSSAEQSEHRHAEMQASVAELSRRLGEEVAKRDAISALYERARRRNAQLRENAERLLDETDLARSERDEACLSIARIEHRIPELESQLQDVVHGNDILSERLTALKLERDLALQESAAALLRADNAEEQTRALMGHANALRTALDVAERKREHYEARVFELNEALATLEAKYRKELVAASEHIEKITAHLNQASEQCRALEKRIYDIEKADNRDNEAVYLRQISEQAEAHRAQLRRSEALINASQAQQRSLSRHLAGMRSEIERLEAEQAIGKEEAVQLRLDLDARKSALQQASEYARKVENAYSGALGRVKELEQRLNDAEARCRNATTDATMARSQTNEAQAQLREREWLLDQIRRSKFWRLRNAWFAAKKAFGVTSDIA